MFDEEKFADFKGESEAPLWDHTGRANDEYLVQKNQAYVREVLNPLRLSAACSGGNGRDFQCFCDGGQSFIFFAGFFDHSARN